MKVIGFVPMKKKEGEVVFVTEQGRGTVVGQSCENLYLFGEVSKKVDEHSIGKEIEVLYGRGYNGNAYVADVTIKQVVGGNAST